MKQSTFMSNSPLKIFIIAILLCAFSAHAMTDKQESKSSTSAKPNIVFIAIDDMNDWVGFMDGHPQAITPNMDKLANDGVAFMNAHSVAPGCSPSRNALLYGVEPYNSGLYPFYEFDIHQQLHEKYTSLPRFLKDNGYQTFGSGKIHHGPEYSDLEWTEYLTTKKYPKQFAKGKGFRNNGKASFRPTTNPYEELPDYQVASYGIDVIKNSKKNDKPYFAAIGIVKPHLPFDCPEEFYDALPEKITPPAILASDLNDLPKEGNSMRRAGDDKKFTNNNQWGDVRKAYLSCILWADYNVGRIMEAVENSPQADNTIVILWSDHGFHLGEKRSFKKFTLWEEANRVPFIIHDRREKGVAKGRKVTQAVTLINVYRTLADMAGLTVPEYVDGNSLVPQLLDQSAPVLSPAIASWGRGNYAVRTENWRFIQYFNGEQELYNHQKDNNEWHNLANLPEYKSKVKELAALLPENEAPTIEEYIADWSLFGADKQRLKKASAEDTNKNKTKKQKKKANKNPKKL
jgi:arylsulfatase A-like enzyme